MRAVWLPAERTAPSVLDAMLIPLAVSIALTAVTYVLIERPFPRAGRRGAEPAPGRPDRDEAPSDCAVA